MSAAAAPRSGAAGGGGRPVLVFAGGDPPSSGDLADLPDGALVVAADSGAEHAVAAGFAVDVLVGDLDSIDPRLTERLAAAGTRIERHPAAKDQTDLALALDTAVELGGGRITVVGGHGGRLDHLLANVLLLAADAYGAVAVDARMGGGRITIVRHQRTVEGAPGDLVSLLAVGGSAYGVHTEGLLFTLRGATLPPGSSWGVSNEMVGRSATVRIEQGVVAVVQPGVRGALSDRAESR